MSLGAARVLLSLRHNSATMVGVAQLVRAPGCGPGCRGFESPRSPHCCSRSTALARKRAGAFGFVVSDFGSEMGADAPEGGPAEGQPLDGNSVEAAPGSLSSS